VAVEVFDENETRHAFQHRHFDELTLAGAFAMKQRGGNGLRHEQP
jgi:hypothetical protein